MVIKKYGFCSEQKGIVSIDINYLDAFTTENNEYTKGRYSCDFKSCNRNFCPIWKNAPEVIRP